MSTLNLSNLPQGGLLDGGASGGPSLPFNFAGISPDRLRALGLLDQFGAPNASPVAGGGGIQLQPSSIYSSPGTRPGFGAPNPGAQYLNQTGVNFLDAKGNILSPDAAKFSGGLLVHGTSPIVPPPAPPVIPPDPADSNAGGGGDGNTGGTGNGSDGTNTSGNTGSAGNSADPFGGSSLDNGLGVDTRGPQSISDRIGSFVGDKLGTGPGNHLGSTLGTLGTLGGLALGATGLGTVGGLLGTAIDAVNEDSDRSRVGIPGLSIGDIGMGLLSNLTNDVVGRSFDQSLAGTNLSGTAATAGLDTNNPDSPNSGNASGGKNGVGESAAGIGTETEQDTADRAAQDEESAEGTDRGDPTSSESGGSHESDNNDGSDGSYATGGLVKGQLMYGNRRPGKKAGGLMKGPGTSTSDSIPIDVSKDEYVMDAKTVRHYGPAFFMALQKRAHSKRPAVKLGNRSVAR